VLVVSIRARGFQALEKVCGIDVVLILDEVQSGFGRSGKFYINIMTSNLI
jgi:acetylornithine/succinyldiaminopimelate/putrescine aminotransferase